MSARHRNDRTARAHPSLAQVVKEHILRKIGEGLLVPGDRIIEMRIAAELDSSQAPVREAIRELETLGVLESSRNRGAWVRTYDLAQVREIYDVRAELESYAVRLILEAGSLTKDELATAIQRMHDAARRDDAMTFSEGNADFHRALVRQSGNGALLELWEMLDIKSRTFLNIGRQGSDLMRIADSHLPVVAALAADDRMKAEAQIRSHILANRP